MILRCKLKLIHIRRGMPLDTVNIWIIIDGFIYNGLRCCIDLLKGFEDIMNDLIIGKFRIIVFKRKVRYALLNELDTVIQI